MPRGGSNPRAHQGLHGSTKCAKYTQRDLLSLKKEGTPDTGHSIGDPEIAMLSETSHHKKTNTV